MILLILAILVPIIVFWYSRDTEETVASAICSLMIFVLLTLILGLASGVESHRIDSKLYIYSIKNQSAISGSFFLGSGNISSTEYYYTFYQDSDGAFRRWQIPAHDARIFMDTDNRPYISYQTIVYKPNKWIALFGPSSKIETLKDIHVPQNTIIQKFEIQ